MDGIRTVKTNGSTIHHYTLNGFQIVTETWTAKSSSGVETPNHFLVYLYDENGAPVGLQYRNKTYGTYTFDTYYFEKNLQGDIIAIYTENGTKIGSYTYDAWGNCTVSTESGTTTIQKRIVRTLNPFRYRGYYYDTDTGLYYLQSRYYVPQWGRFLNADGYVNTGMGLLGYNMYAYCSNNPVNRVDSTGQFWKELWDAFTQTIQQASGFFAVAAGISQVDTPAPGPADVVSGVLLLGGALVCAGVALYTTITATTPAIPCPNFKDKDEAKDEAKDEVIPAPPQNNGTTYYHVTTEANALSIISSGYTYGSAWEGGYVYAWKTFPNNYAIENSGAHMGVVISFKTNATFVMDPGITDSRVQMLGPVVSTVPGPIAVWDVQIVGWQK